MRKLLAAVFLGSTTTLALAVEAPKLPQDAKKLDTAEIKAIYDDKTLTGEYYGTKVLITWTSTNSSSAGTVDGTWSGADGSTGKTNLKYAIKKNKWCTTRPGKKESCSDVYSDGTYGYEVNKGIVQSRFKLP